MENTMIWFLPLEVGLMWEMVDIQRRVLKYNRASSLHVFLYVDKESRQFSHFSP